MSSAAITVENEVLLAMPDGNTYRVRPGPYGKGVSIIPIIGKVSSPSSGPGTRGRKPRASTVALRKRLVSDMKKGGVKDAAEYIAWLQARDDAVSLAVARQVVYRERRRALDGALE